MHLKIENNLNKIKTFVLIVRGAFEINSLSLYHIDNKKIILLDEITIPSKLASKLLASSIQDIFNRNEINLTDLLFILADQGPGAFTTIRTTAATINGICFQKKICIIPFNSLEEGVLNLTLDHPSAKLLIHAINAYGKQVFFCIYDQYKKCLIKTNICTKIQAFINEVVDLSKKHDSIVLTGNAVEVYQEEMSVLQKHEIKIFNKNELNEVALIKKNLNQHERAKNQIFPFYVKPGF